MRTTIPADPLLQMREQRLLSRGHLLRSVAALGGGALWLSLPPAVSPAFMTLSYTLCGACGLVEFDRALLHWRRYEVTRQRVARRRRAWQRDHDSQRLAWPVEATVRGRRIP